MRFPRNARIFRGQFDPAPFISVFFLLLVFFLFHSSLVFTPGVRIELPVASEELPGVRQPTILVAVDASGRFYFENRRLSQQDLKEELDRAVRRYDQPVVLVIQADKGTDMEDLVALKILAQQAGIRFVLEATRPPIFGAPIAPPSN